LSLGGVIVVEHGGDLDGDGRRDLLVSREPALLGIYRGVPETLFEEKPAATVAIPDPTEYAQIKSAAGELNGDRRSDILVHYQGRGDRRDKLVLLLSRKK
ncbi:MAG: FG-GAP repeat domain-containing protein, partial [Planctomycetota bacterium]